MSEEKLNKLLQSCPGDVGIIDWVYNRMSEENDELVQSIESTANFMRGMTLDPQIPTSVKNALQHKIKELDAISEKYS